MEKEKKKKIYDLGTDLRVRENKNKRPKLKEKNININKKVPYLLLSFRHFFKEISHITNVWRWQHFHSGFNLYINIYGHPLPLHHT